MGEIMKNSIRKYIVPVLMLLVIISIISVVTPIHNVYGQINQVTNVESPAGDVLKNIIGVLLKFSAGPLFAVIAGLVNLILLVVFMFLYTVFVSAGISVTFPFPDQVIFNKIAFFDPNFINPPSTGGHIIESSPIAVVQPIIQKLYYTSFVVAGTIFVIAALIIGIKLAISTIASDKAHYKQALTNWLVGLVLLFTVHFLIAGIFAINEKIVEIASSTVAGNNITFKLDVLTAIPGIGSTIGKVASDVIGGISKLLGGPSTPTAIDLPGYGGMILMFAAKAMGGDLVSSIICGILLGQTVIIVVLYLRRMFYCILLGMLAPAIVAVDVIKKTI